jgi:uncharacterized protein YaiI (UPF0178 family)
MSSEPVPEYIYSTKAKQRINLRNNAHNLDHNGFAFQHVDVDNAWLKSDLMTKSSKNMLKERQKGQQSGSDAIKGRERQEAFARVLEQAGRTGMDEGSEDELA